MSFCRVPQEQVKEQSFDDKARSETEFFNYVSTAYRHFMSGHDEECAAVDEAQTRVFHDRVEAAQTRNAELQQVGLQQIYHTFLQWFKSPRTPHMLCGIPHLVARPVRACHISPHRSRGSANCGL